MVSDDWIWLVRPLVIAAVALVWLARSRLKLSTAMKHAATWCGLMLLVIVGYGYRTELSTVAQRTTANLIPGYGRTIDEHTVSFALARDRHFWIDAFADQKAVRFLLDTGASGIVLTKADAARLGFTAADLSFTETFSTANGTTRGAPVLLTELRIGPIVLDRVRAFVNEGEMRQSLLGMHFLERMTSLEIKGDVLTIRR